MALQILMIFLDFLGVEALANYIVKEVQNVYRLQGVKISDKHIEVVVKQMLRKVEIIDNGDSNYVNGETAEHAHVVEKNKQLKAQNKKEISFPEVINGNYKGFIYQLSRLSLLLHSKKQQEFLLRHRLQEESMTLEVLKRM